MFMARLQLACPPASAYQVTARNKSCIATITSLQVYSLHMHMHVGLCSDDLCYNLALQVRTAAPYCLHAAWSPDVDREMVVLQVRAAGKGVADSTASLYAGVQRLV